jgi:hypothetical protein
MIIRSYLLRRLIRFLSVGIVIVVFLQLAMAYKIKSLFSAYDIQGIGWYIDGVVISKVKLTPQISAKNIYIEGNPFELIIGQPKAVVIGSLYLNKPTFLDLSKIIVPDTKIVVDKSYLSMGYQDYTYNFIGDYRVIDLNHHRISFTSEDKTSDAVFDVSVTLYKGSVDVVDINADQFFIERPELQLKRGAVWLRAEKKDKVLWDISGEIEAGFMIYARHIFLDPHIAVHDNEILFSARDKMNKNEIVIDVPSLRITDLLTRLLALPVMDLDLKSR